MKTATMKWKFSSCKSSASAGKNVAVSNLPKRQITIELLSVTLILCVEEAWKEEDDCSKR